MTTLLSDICGPAEGQDTASRRGCESHESRQVYPSIRQDSHGQDVLNIVNFYNALPTHAPAAIREANGKAWPDGRPKGEGWRPESAGPPLLLGSPSLPSLPGVQKKIGATAPIFLVVAGGRLELPT